MAARRAAERQRVAACRAMRAGTPSARLMMPQSVILMLFSPSVLLRCRFFSTHTAALIFFFATTLLCLRHGGASAYAAIAYTRCRVYAAITPLRFISRRLSYAVGQANFHAYFCFILHMAASFCLHLFSLISHYVAPSRYRQAYKRMVFAVSSMLPIFAMPRFGSRCCCYAHCFIDIAESFFALPYAFHAAAAVTRFSLRHIFRRRFTLGRQNINRILFAPLLLLLPRHADAAAICSLPLRYITLRHAHAIAALFAIFLYLFICCHYYFFAIIFCDCRFSLLMAFSRDFFDAVCLDY